MRVKAENLEALRQVFEAEGSREVKGYVSTHVLRENDSENIWLIAVFEDRATYEANADDPAQHEMYVKYRALLEEDPEWHDGEIETYTS